MRYTEIELLQSEIGTVEGLLAETPADELITRLSWENRLRTLRARLAEAEARPQPKPLSITFRGDPVEGTRSIDAVFASKALKAFVEATDTVTASLLAEDLRDRGRLPKPQSRSLRIVDTAVGSFGFELELPPPPETDGQAQLFAADGPDVHAEAIATTLKLIDEASTEDDDAISDLVAEIHPRAAAKVHAFATILRDSRALAAVAFGGRQVRLDANEQVARVVETLSAMAAENEEASVGTLIGVLPASRRFEARLKDGRVISGRIDRAIQDIMDFKSRWEDREALLTLLVIKVRSLTRYILTAATDPPSAADADVPPPDPQTS